MDYLSREYGIDTVNLEGGAKDYDLSVFTGIYDKTIREKTADYFVKEGLVNGAEYFAINNPEKANLWGIEDTRLYIDNLNIYRDSLKHKEEVDKHLDAITHILANLKTKIYSKELLELDTRYSQYKSGKIEFKDYLAYLVQSAERKAIDVKAFANIYLLSHALNEERDIDFKKANNERDDLIDKLQKKLSKKSLEELVVHTVEFRSERISQKDFYVYLAKKASVVNVGLNDFPDFQKYIAYISKYNAVDKMKIMDEMADLENKIKESSYQNDNQRELDKLSKNLAILKNIFNITLTKEDYKYYKANEESFRMARYEDFVNKNNFTDKQKNGDSPHRFGDNSPGTVPIFLDRYREEISKFYECSFKRDDAFMRNMMFKSASPVLLITGGFHTDNLCDLFKRKNISYVSIIPNFKSSDGYDCPYFSLLKGDIGPKPGIVDKIYSSINPSSLAVADLWNALGEEVWGSNVSRAKLWVALKAISERPENAWDLADMTSVKRTGDKLEITTTAGIHIIPINDLFSEATPTPPPATQYL